MLVIYSSGGVEGMWWQLVVEKFGVLVWWWCSGDVDRCVGGVIM